jgi:hypothetical protein
LQQEACRKGLNLIIIIIIIETQIFMPRLRITTVPEVLNQVDFKVFDPEVAEVIVPTLEEIISLQGTPEVVLGEHTEDSEEGISAHYVVICTTLPQTATTYETTMATSSK